MSGGPYLFGDYLETSAVKNIPAQFTAAWLNEQIEQHTHAKVSTFDMTTPYMVGPCARLALSMPTAYEAMFTDASIRSSLKARIVELQMAVERAQVVIGELLLEGIKKELPISARPMLGEGTSLMEAPRGVLLHNYCLDPNGICSHANIITPTAINQSALAASLKSLIKIMDGAEPNKIKKLAEILIRCYDPCISCAVH